MAIGRDLLDLPFAEMVRNLAVAIADGQTALDRNSLDTLRALVATEVDVITDVAEVIEPYEHEVDIDVPDGDGGTVSETIVVTGARVTASGVPPVRMNMVQAGLFPTFYQFTEAAIEVKLSITMREDREREGAERTAPFRGLGVSRAYAASVDYRSANKYNYTATGASVLRATMRPVPPPSRLEPTITTINRLTDPVTITRSPQ